MHRPLSIVIPTHKRAEILHRTLEHLAAQSAKSQIEVIVVSDGPDAHTQKLMETSSWDFPVRFIEIEKSQQGIARNRGVAEARGKYCLFIGDDIFLGPAACERHLAAHAANGQPVAVLGHTTWDPALELNQVMLWLEESGWQFGYPMLREYQHKLLPPGLQHRFTYTSHISLPLKIAKSHPFLEDVSLYGWEDIEWGQRLQKAGVRLYYEPDAHAFHHHHLTLEASLKRMETLGISAVHLSRIAPDLDRIPKSWKAMAYAIVSLLPTIRGRHAKAFLRGIRRGKTLPTVH
jgi:glycosyltransferase involved in cell wall biosynthesis